jgi:epoxide hydrolase-like predicted phosphatase
MPIKAVIFDMGGVILRTEDQSPRQGLAEEYHLSLEELNNLVFYSETSTLAEVGRVPEGQHWLKVFEAIKVPADEQRHFIEQFWAGDRVDSRLVDFIRELKAERPVGLLSNAWSGTRSNLQERYDFLSLFTAAIFSAEVGLRKPDPQIYHLILAQLNVAADESVFVDDFPANVRAARELGIHAVQFKKTDQAIGEVRRLLAGQEGSKPA